MEWHKVTSSNVEAVAYEAEAKVAHVRFISGTEYTYEGVSKTDFDALRTAPSVGVHLARVFKRKYVGHPDFAAVLRAPEREAGLLEIATLESAVLRAAVAWLADASGETEGRRRAMEWSPEIAALEEAVRAYVAHPLFPKPIPKTPTQA